MGKFTVIIWGLLLLLNIGAIANCPQVNLGKDTTICRGQRIFLSAHHNTRYLYRWYPGNETTRNLSVMVSGIYIVEVTDTIAKCTVRDTIKITVLPKPKITKVNTVKASDCRANDASIALEAEGNYSYIWRDEQMQVISTNKDIDNLSVGVYEVLISAPNSCDTILTVAVNGEKTPLWFPWPKITHESCRGNDGAIDAGAKPDGVTFQYHWTKQGDTLYFRKTEDIINLKAGNYNVTVTDPTGCKISAAYIRVNKINFGFDLGPHIIACDTNLQAINTAPTGNFEYTWYTLDGNITTPTTQKNITVDAPGKYHLTLKNHLDCIAKDSVTVIFRKINVDLGGNISVCTNDSFTLKPLENYPQNYVYSWFHDDQYVFSSYSNSYSVFQTGKYSLQVQDADGKCVSKDEIEIKLNSIPEDILKDTSFCQGQYVTLDAGNAGASYQWSNGGNDRYLTVHEPGIYWVNIENPEGCQLERSVNIATAAVPHVPILTDTIWMCIDEGDQYKLLDDSYEVENNISWLNNDSKLISNRSDFKPMLTGLYTLKLETKSHGCIAEKSFFVENKCIGTIHVPNAFSPNDDHTNDVFEIKGDLNLIKNFKFYLYNRWGELIVIKNSPYDTWNGTRLGKKVPEGTYVYVLSYKINNGNGDREIVQKGTVTIIR